MLRYKQHEKQISAGYFLTTNNRMELRAVIEALNTLKEPCSVTLHSDSQYMKNGITKWIFNWKKNTGKPAPASP
ncbi:ribonuclease H, partial [Pasteurella multocida subsp. multocida str. Anand1_cattle]